MTVDPYHPQVKALSEHGPIEVDERLKSVLEWSWRQGIETEYSCQGDTGEKAYIMFRDAASAERFLAGVAGLSETLKERVHRTEPYSSDQNPSWQLVAFPLDESCGAWSHEGCEATRVMPRIRIALRLPSHEIELIGAAIGRQ